MCIIQDWYLLNQSTRPNVTGGYENESFLENKDDSFAEALQTDIATAVILYNSDLSHPKHIRCIVQGNTADTHLKSLERTVLFEIGTVKAGMYVFFENRYWLIDGYPGNNKIYEKATMVLCQYLMRWQNASGEIIERWCNAVSASKYDVGENGNFTINLTSNSYTIKLPYDNECILLDRKRVFLDRKKVNPDKVFKLTRTDDILYDYGDEDHGSILSFIADKTELNLLTDNRELKICDYIDVSKPVPPEQSDRPEFFIFADIIGSDSIKLNRAKTYQVKFYRDKNKTDEFEYSDFTWKIEPDVKVETSISESSIDVKVTDNNEVGQIFKLQIVINDTIISEKKIKISNLF